MNPFRDQSPADLFAALSSAFVASAVAFGSAAHTEPTGTQAPKPGAPAIEVQYADTFQGQSARLAVRACADAANGENGPGAKDVRAPIIRFVQLKADTTADVVVRVLSGSGREVSRHEGPGDVCGYARFAASLTRALAKANETSGG